MFTYKKTINFYDCDPAGILFFAKIFELCHSAYESLIRSFNLKEDYWNSDEFVVPIIKSEASFHYPIKNGDEITVELFVKQLKDSSFELNYICKNTRGDLCNEVKTIHVFVRKSTWTKTKMKAEIHKGLLNYYNQA
ncbi:MAG: hypothetical protein AUK34_12060 [Ignavibacteria bacterium CG2_30_36_16]|nr:acyl-CoA thioesterase [Ignavibacteria bacterium]OIP56065.1 MAG: hypothetical protein AUK34_12060 [Ignavibacteria bacterium CG2_30_36_16]